MTDLRRVALKDVAVVLHPFSLEQVDLAFFGVNPVLGKHERAMIFFFQQRPEQAGIAGRNSMVSAHRNEIPRNFRQHPDRCMHRSDGPKIIDERGIRTIIPVIFLDVFP